LLQLFFDLSEDFATIRSCKRVDLLQSLRHEADEGVAETTPLHVDIVAGQRNLEGELCLVRHVRELAEGFVKHALPDLGKDGGVGRAAEFEVVRVDFAGNNALRLLELVVFLVPKICNAIPLLHELGSCGESRILRQDVKVRRDHIVLGR